MNLLLFSDIHTSLSAMQQLIKVAGQVDVLVGGGDFGVMRSGTVETLAPLETINRPCVLVCGNAESPDELREAAPWSHCHVLHGTSVEIQGVQFFGLGGGIPVTPFGSWSYDLDEQQAEAELDKWPPFDGPSVLVVHSPPNDVVDLSSAGKHLGSHAVRSAIESRQPDLAVCGHIHSSAGRWGKLGSTSVVNAGPSGVVWNLESSQPVRN